MKNQVFFLISRSSLHSKSKFNSLRHLQPCPSIKLRYPIRSFSTTNMAKMSTPIPELKLNDGTSIQMIAYGTGTAWSKRTSPEAEVDREIVEGVKIAIKTGYRHFDCAESYRNEVDLGVALKESSLPRDQVYVVTKVLESTNDIENGIKTSLKKLQLDYVDLYLIHAPYFADEGKDKAKLQAAWATMEKVKEAGLTKSIGVSNFLIPHLEAILETAKVVPAVNQIEFHPYLQRTELLEFSKKHGIVIEAYGPLSAVTKGAGGPADDILASLAKKYAVTTSEISLRWAIDQGVVVVTTSGKEQRLSDYLRVTKFQLTPNEVEEISKVSQSKHLRGFWAKKFDPNDRS